VKLISDQITEQVSFLVEEKEGKKTFYIEGIAAQAGVANRNRRFYPPDVLGREIDKYIEDKVKTGSALGELAHPDNPSLNLDRVSHIFRSVRRDNNDWYAKAALVETPCGKIAEGLLQAGARIGFSTRGLGSLKQDEKNGYSIVQNDYKLAVLADLVADPSAPNAFVKGVLEGVEFYQKDDGSWAIEEHIDNLKKDLKKQTRAELAEDKSKVFLQFFDLLNMVQEDAGTLVGGLAVAAGVDSARAWDAWETARKRALREGHEAGDLRYIQSLAKRYLGL
jgi:hypothetical protein